MLKSLSLYFCALARFPIPSYMIRRGAKTGDTAFQRRRRSAAAPKPAIRLFNGGAVPPRRQNRRCRFSTGLVKT
jgi:hypothetical protein